MDCYLIVFIYLFIFIFFTAILDIEEISDRELKSQKERNRLIHLFWDLHSSLDLFIYYQLEKNFSKDIVFSLVCDFFFFFCMFACLYVYLWTR